jgi:MYXO-CTERM domain-containing protein
MTKSESASLPETFLSQYDLALAELGMSGNPSNVPEPGGLGLGATAAGLLVRRRARRRR